MKYMAAVPPKNAPSSGADLAELKKIMASYLAQKLTFSLFQEGRSVELIKKIHDLVEFKLLEDGIPIEPAMREELVRQIIEGMSVSLSSLQDSKLLSEPKKPAEIVSKSTPVDQDEFSIEELLHLIKPFLASILPDALFQPDRKADLVRVIREQVEFKFQAEALIVRPALKEELFQNLFHTMGLESTIPTEAGETPQPESPAEVSPKNAEAPAVWEVEEGLPTAVIPNLKPRVQPKPTLPIVKSPPQTFLPLKALTHEIKRDLLYYLSSKLDPAAMATADELTLRTEIFRLIQVYCTENRFMLNDQEVEQIVLEILGGEGLEFQL
ncbi:MAG: hypothetical protein ACFCUX_01010 [Candidatus Methylacidiphilales bacterium]